MQFLFFIGAQLRKDTEPELYKKNLKSHKCLINYIGSAGSMEAEDLVDCFVSSKKTLLHSLCW